MDERTASGLRDGLLAVVALGGLLDGLRRRGRLGALRSPAAGVVGVLGTVSMEAILLRYPERAKSVWGRPPVQATGLLGTVAAGRSLARGSGPRAAAALCWGLFAYLLLLGPVLVGRRTPLSSFRRR